MQLQLKKALTCWVLRVEKKSLFRRVELNLFLSTRGLEMVREGEEPSTFLRVEKMGKSSIEENTQRSLWKIPLPRNLRTLVSMIVFCMARCFCTYVEQLSWLPCCSRFASLGSLLRLHWRHSHQSNEVLGGHLAIAITVALSSDIVDAQAPLKQTPGTMNLFTLVCSWPTNLPKSNISSPLILVMATHPVWLLSPLRNQRKLCL